MVHLLVLKGGGALSPHTCQHLGFWSFKETMGFLVAVFLSAIIPSKNSLEVRYEGLQIKQFIFLIYLVMEREEFFASAALWQLG